MPLQRSAWRTISTLFRQFLSRDKILSPYLSGDRFSVLCDYAAYGADGSRPFNAVRAANARSIFVVADRLEDLVNEGSRLAIRPDVVVTGNSDRNFVVPSPNPLSCRLWICQNNAMPQREGLQTLPIFLENRKLGRLGRAQFYSAQKRRAIQGPTKVLVPPMSPTNPARLQRVREGTGRPDVYAVFRNYLPAGQYMKLLRKFQFVLCLEGNGFENHRIWEALYLGIFPVVIESNWSKSLRKFGLPIMFIKSIEEVTMSRLHEFVEDNQNFNPDHAEVLWEPYWKDLISPN